MGSTIRSGHTVREYITAQQPSSYHPYYNILNTAYN